MSKRKQLRRISAKHSARKRYEERYAQNGEQRVNVWTPQALVALAMAAESTRLQRVPTMGEIVARGLELVAAATPTAPAAVAG